MKRFDDFTARDLWQLRKEIILGSLFTGDFRNSFGLDPQCVQDFFDGYASYLCSTASEEGNYEGRSILDVYAAYDTSDALWEWYQSFDDFDWMKYEEE